MDDALSIFRAALRAVEPAAAVERHFRREGESLRVGRRRYDLGRFRSIWVVGAGKAGAAMAKGVEKVLGKRVRGGLVNVKHGHTAPLRRIELNEAGHPVPDASGADGAQRIAEIAREAGDDDLIVCLISGGASALLPWAADSLTLEDKQRVTQQLLDSGADIHAINCVRKHLSAVKGGQLAAVAYPATVISLILSDVIGDDLDVIGSGPTAPDRSTIADAQAILEKYSLPRSPLYETPKPGDPVFERVQNVVVGSNRLALNAAAARAKELGYRTEVLTACLQGEAREVARVHAAIAIEPRSGRRCFLSGGETTVTVRGKGLGGRNQEFALAAAIDLDGVDNAILLSAGTDGTDGPTDAAGALVNGTTVDRGRRLGLDAASFLARNDSYRFFEKTGGLIKTGPTGTNVMDIQVVLTWS